MKSRPVSLGNALERLPRVPGDDLVHQLPVANDLLGLDLDVNGLALGAAVGLVQEDPRMRERVALALRAVASGLRSGAGSDGGGSNGGGGLGFGVSCGSFSPIYLPLRVVTRYWAKGSAVSPLGNRRYTRPPTGNSPKSLNRALEDALFLGRAHGLG